MARLTLTMPRNAKQTQRPNKWDSTPYRLRVRYTQSFSYSHTGSWNSTSKQRESKHPHDQNHGQKRGTLNAETEAHPGKRQLLSDLAPPQKLCATLCAMNEQRISYEGTCTTSSTGRVGQSQLLMPIRPPIRSFKGTTCPYIS